MDNGKNKKTESENNELATEDLSQLEIKRIKESIERSDNEKFLLFTRLMRVHYMLKKAVIVKQ